METLNKTRPAESKWTGLLRKSIPCNDLFLLPLSTFVLFKEKRPFATSPSGWPVSGYLKIIICCVLVCAFFSLSLFASAPLSPTDLLQQTTKPSQRRQRCILWPAGCCSLFIQAHLTSCFFSLAGVLRFLYLMDIQYNTTEPNTDRSNSQSTAGEQYSPELWDCDCLGSYPSLA